MKRRPRVYFSLRSPFSWFAMRQLEERLPEADQLFDFVPFFEPDADFKRELEERGAEFHYVPMSKAKHLYILQDTKRLAQRYGYPMVWPIDVDPWWVLPHLAWLKARRLGVHREYYRAVMQARWERGEDICETDVLHRILTDAGLQADTLVAAPSDPEIREEGLQALVQVYEDDIFGVPYFKLGFHRFWGLDRLDDFLAALDATRQRQAVTIPQEGIPAAVIASVGSVDHDTAGGCG